ncbi:hypothetical protein ACM17_23955 [Escherichia coli]|jgi:hypothetical protein|nr:hypothetical protein VK74_24725 [Escherichia coli]APK96862.1 hypothetical protein RG54_25090 [Escherichia coli]APL01721.1 hypothetical protein RG55_25070 [Escherichia coli]APL35778.1 hypothetical protein RG62_24915 [Escherichia coli]KMV40125.1 hypothetical protein ACM17_23955 [Escherichia coli]
MRVNNPFVQFNGGHQVLLRNVLTNALTVLTGQYAIYTVYNDSDIVTRICRAGGMEGGALLLNMSQE